MTGFTRLSSFFAGTLLLLLGGLFNHAYYVSYIPHSSHPSVLTKSPSPHPPPLTTTTTTTIATPPPLSALLPRVRAADVSSIAAKSFLHPHIITTYLRPSLLLPPPALDLFVLTSALNLRNLSVQACVVDGQLIIPDSHLMEITMCVLARRPRDGATITLVLHADKALRGALRADQPVQGGSSVAPRLVRGTHIEETRSGLFQILSNVTLRHRYLDSFNPHNVTSMPRYALCHATMIRPGGHMIQDWVDHHRRLGVDHVIVFDNGASPSPHETFAGRDDVEVVTWPWAKTQVQAFAFFVITARRRCRHVFLSDVDEYVMVGLGATPFAHARRPMQAVIDDMNRRGFTDMQFRAVAMLNSGYIRQPVGHVPELYTHARIKQMFSFSKSLCTADKDWRMGLIHGCGLVKNGTKPRRYMVGKAELEGKLSPSEIGDAPFIVHFYRRSWEEYVEKWNVGTAGVINGLGRDEKIGLYSLDVVDPSYIVMDHPSIMKYTAFRDFWRRVRREAAGRLDESVIAWEHGGSVVKRVVSVTGRP